MQTQDSSELAPLVGSPNQVAWAEKIRAERIAHLEHVLAVAYEGTSTRPDLVARREAGRAQTTAALAAARRQTAAKWWIDTRLTSVESVAAALAERAEDAGA